MKINIYLQTVGLRCLTISLLFFMSFNVGAVNLYWIGGAGNWNDASHWSNTSGGSAGAVIPTAVDNVFFDSNSFSTPSQSVTLNVTASCADMDWTGATFSPTLYSANQDLHVYGSFTLVSGMSLNLFHIYFNATTAGKTINCAGVTVQQGGYTFFDGVGGDWTLLNDYITPQYLYLTSGSLNTNGFTLSCFLFITNGSNSKVLDLGASIVNINGSNGYWDASASNLVVSAGTSTINLTNVSNSFNGGTQSYNDLNWTNPAGNAVLSGGVSYNKIIFVSPGSVTPASGTYYSYIDFQKSSTINSGNGIFGTARFAEGAIINGNNSFDSLLFASGKTYELASGSTQEIYTYTRGGTCNKPVTIQASLPGSPAAMLSSLPAVTLDNLWLKDITATGGAVFTANNSFDQGNNAGWIINAPMARNLYWRGGTGNWNDSTHWSLTSGGTGGACIPTYVDNVFFDNNSFTSVSKILTVNVPAYCKNISWTGAGFTPIMNGTASLNIYGSITLITAMNITNFTGQVNFKSTSTGNAITSAGKTFAGTIYFDGNGGAWTLQDAFNTSSNIWINAGTFSTNSKNITCNSFYANTSKSKQLLLGASTITVTGASTSCYWDMTLGTNLTVNAGTSHIRFTSSSFVSNFKPGAGSTYHNITFQDFNQQGMFSSNGGNFHNVICNGPSNIYGGIFNKVDFRKVGINYISLNNTYDTLLFAAGSTNYFGANSIQTVNRYFGPNGTSGNLTKIYPETSPNYTLNMSSCTICCNYLDISGCQAIGGASFYADNSTNGGNNSGWNFAACPSTTLSVGPIAGVTNTCANSTGYTYSIPVIAGATYTWTVPGGNTITSGQGTASIQVATAGTAGTISVTASACGTSNTATKTITVNPVPIISSVNINQPTNCIDPDGSATATITSGSSPFTYQWSSGDTLATADSLYSGQYQLTVSDLYGCITSTVVTINSVGGPAVTLGSSSNVTCPGGNNGSLTANVTGGVTPYSYAWTSGATTPTANNLQAGTYVLTVTDSVGCQVVKSYTVTQPTPITIAFSTTPSGCSNSTGDATANVSGGTAGYTYQWSTNAASQTTQTATALAAGLYTVTVTDNAGCQQNASVMVSTNTAGATVTLDNITAGTCGINGPGSIDISTSGGATPYSYSWSNGATTEDISGVSPGTYSLGVIDGNGCMTYTSYLVPPTGPIFQPQICVVTVDTITRNNLVAWDKTGAVGIKEFNIYCEIGSFNNYQLVGTVPAGNLSEFVHVGANPQVKSWKYKISAVDSCGNESALSTYHKTIHLQVNAGIGGVNNLSWDNYFGFNYGSFDVWRYTLTNGWENLSTLPWCGFTVCQNSYTDGAPVPIDTNWYAIFVDPPSPCVTTARFGDPNSPLGTIVKSKSNITNNRVQGAIGITESHSKNNFSVYPNPASNEIKLVLGKDCKNCTLEISNAVGQIIRVENTGMNDNSINISNLANGVYYLKIKGNDAASVVKKLIIQR